MFVVGELLDKIYKIGSTKFFKLTILNILKYEKKSS